MSENQEYKVIDRRTEPETLPAERGPDAMIIMAMQKGYTPELIEKMMQLQERHEATVARKAYHEAMAAFKANPPEIEKDRTVSFGAGKTAYSHASLANVTDKINRALSQQGLSAAWKTAQSDAGVTVECSITHRLGHSESTSLTAMPDTSGSKNSIQAIGSTITYLERYSLLALTGLATHDQDDDGNAASEFITDDQRIEIEKIVVDKGVHVEKFLQYMKVDDTATIPAKDYQKAIAALKKAKGTKDGNT